MIKKIKTFLNKIHKTGIKARKSFQNRALLVIETLVGDDIACTDIEKLKSTIYKIAHSAISPRTCEHKDWKEETEKMFKEFENEGIL